MSWTYGDRSITPVLMATESRNVERSLSFPLPYIRYFTANGPAWPGFGAMSSCWESTALESSGVSLSDCVHAPRASDPAADRQFRNVFALIECVARCGARSGLATIEGQ